MHPDAVGINELVLQVSHSGFTPFLYWVQGSPLPEPAVGSAKITNA